jgi:predicted transcriptional regulator
VSKIQSDIYDLLKATRKAMTASQVGKSLSIGRNNATRKLNQLAKYRLIKRTQHKVLIRTQKHLIYKFRVI